MVFAVGHRLALDIEAHDGGTAGVFPHNDQADRSYVKLAGTNTIYTGAERVSFLPLPIIPH